MKNVIDAGTDVAMIGAWDEGVRTDPLDDAMPSSRRRQALLDDAKRARLFLVMTGVDGASDVQVHVDEPIPASLRSALRKCRGRFRIAVPSGRLMVGGAEDYRSAAPRVTSDASVVVVAPGDYAVELYAAKDVEQTGDQLPSHDELERIVGAEYLYFRAVERRALRGLWLLLLFPLLTPWLGWKLALAGTLVPLAAYSLVHAWRLKRDARYHAAVGRVNAACRSFLRRGVPALAMTLRRLRDDEPLDGGIVELEGGHDS